MGQSYSCRQYQGVTIVPGGAARAPRLWVESHDPPDRRSAEVTGEGRPRDELAEQSAVRAAEHRVADFRLRRWCGGADRRRAAATEHPGVTMRGDYRLEHDDVDRHARGARPSRGRRRRAVGLGPNTAAHQLSRAIDSWDVQRCAGQNKAQSYNRSRSRCLT
jgi:hypothetical protein